MRFRFYLWILLATMAALFASGGDSIARSLSLKTLVAMRDQVTALSKAGKYFEAIPLSERYALAIRQQFGETHKFYSAALNDLGSLYSGVGKQQEAEAAYRKAIEINEVRFGPEHVEGAPALNNLAWLLHNMGRFTELEKLHRRALSIDEAAYGPDEPATAIDLNNLALLLKDMGRNEEAEVLHRRALKIDETKLGPDDPQTANDMVALASLLGAMERHVEAEQLLRKALAIERKKLGPNHPNYAGTLNNLGVLLNRTNRLKEAEEVTRQALRITEARLGANHYQVAIAVSNLASLVEAGGNLREAESLYRRALQIDEQSLGTDHPFLAGDLVALAGVLEQQGDWAAALPYRTRAKPLMSLSAVAARGDISRRVIERRHGEYFRAHARALHRVDAKNPTTLPEAFELAQLALQTSAADALSNLAARFAKGDTKLAGLVRVQQDLTSQREAAYRRLDQATGNADLGAVAVARSDVAAAETKLKANASILEREFKDYAEFSDPKPLPLREAQRLLHDHEALILTIDIPQLNALPEETIVFVMTNTSTGARPPTSSVAGFAPSICSQCWPAACSHRVASRPQRSAATRPVRALVPSSVCSQRASFVVPFDLARAHELYNALLGPAEDLIKGKQLIIVPSGPLTSLPFNVLITERPKVAIPNKLAEYREASWLGGARPLACCRRLPRSKHYASSLR